MNSKLVKILSLLVAMAFLFTLLAGCGQTQSGSTEGTTAAGTAGSTAAAADAVTTAPAEEVTIIKMGWGTSETQDKDNADFKQLFPDMANVTVEYLVAGPSDSDVANKFRLALSSNDSICDLIGLNYTQVPEFAEADVLEDLSDVIDPVKDQLLSGALNVAQYKGKIIATPSEVKAKLWFYRKDMFDAAGIDPSKVKTLDDFIAAGKQLQAKYPKSYIMNFGKTIQQYTYMMPLSGTDCSFSDDKGNYILDTESNVRKLLEAYKKMNDSGIIAPISDWTPDWEKAFSDGTLASSLCANWLAVTFFLPKYAAGQEGKWACAQWPSIIGEVGGSEAGGSITVIPKFAKNKEIAKKYLAKCLSKEWALRTYKEVGVFPINKEAIADPEVQAPNAFFGTSFVTETTKAFENLKVFKYSPSAAQEISIITPYFDKAVNGQLSIDEALKQAQADLKNQIGNALSKK